MNKVVKNLRNNFQYFDETAMVATCSDKENCAKDAFVKMVADNPKAQENFAKTFRDIVFQTPRQGDGCHLGRTRAKFNATEGGARFADKVHCSTRGWCETGKNYDIKYEGEDVKTQGLKVCDACVYYQCTADGGKKIMGGFGCYEDFEKICQMVPLNVKESIKLNLKTSYHFDENYLVVTCSNGNDCLSQEYHRFYDVHPFNKIKVNPEYDGKCEHGIAGAKPSSTISYPNSFASSLQINLWTLLGIIIAGFAFNIF
uniref:Uncharacterized protein n=1 Tax=Panagrolaimus sp. ES5 TaxID=591445 RepID=A0AC34GVN9_9BILA